MVSPSHTTTRQSHRCPPVAVAVSADCGRKVPARSRATSMFTFPVGSVSTALARLVRLRTFSGSRPAGSRLLWPTFFGHLLVQRGLEDVLGGLLEQVLRTGEGPALLLGPFGPARRPQQLPRPDVGPFFALTALDVVVITAPTPSQHGSACRPEPPLRNTPPGAGHGEQSELLDGE